MTARMSVASESQYSDRRMRSRDVTIDAQIQGDVHAEQTNVAAGDDSISIEHL